MESLRSSKRIKLIVTRHEQAAAMMAATVGRLTGLQPPNPCLLASCAATYISRLVLLASAFRRCSTSAAVSLDRAFVQV